MQDEECFLSLDVSFDGEGAKKLANENLTTILSVPPKTGVAKRYPCHTTFQTGVAAATPATPLPAPLSGMQIEILFPLR